MVQIKKNSINVVVICIALFATSWEAVIGFSYIDEICIIVLMLMCLLSLKKISGTMAWFSILYLFILFCGGVGYDNISIIDILDKMKPIAILFSFMIFDFSEKQIDGMFSFFEIINIPSILIGIMNVYMYGNTGRVLFESGTYKEIDGNIVLRMGGFVGHSGTMAEICLVLIICSLFKTRAFSWEKIVKVGFYFIGLLATRQRFCLYVAVITFVVWVLFMIPDGYRKYVVIISVFAICVIGMMYFTDIIQIINRNFASDFENQIRFKALRRALMFDYNLIWGNGAGYLGTRYESNIAIVMVESGFCGLILYYGAFIYCGLKIYFSKTRYHVIGTYIMVFYLMNSIINKGYSIPILFVIGILLSESNNYSVDVSDR